MKSLSEKTSSERVPLEKRVSYEKQTLLQEGKCFNCQKTGHMMRDCPEKKSMIDLEGGNSPVNLSNYLKEKFNYDLFLSKAELASEKFDGSISICPPPDDMKVYIPVTWGQEKSLDVHKGDMFLSAALGLCFILFDLEACLLRKRNWENNLEKGNQKGNCEKRKRKRHSTNKKFPKRGINVCQFGKSVTQTSTLNLKHQN